MARCSNLSFPRLRAPASPEGIAGEPRIAVRAAGAVLLVEDQAEVRRLAGTILRNMGFTVLEAGDAGQAISVAEQFDGEIRMMLTDVIMPGMNGRELADRVAELRPRTKIVYMSGYTDRVMGIDGELDDTVEYLQKPFTAAAAKCYRVPGTPRTGLEAEFQRSMREYCLDD